MNDTSSMEAQKSDSATKENASGMEMRPRDDPPPPSPPPPPPPVEDEEEKEFSVDDLFDSAGETQEQSKPAFQAWTPAGSNKSLKARVEAILKQNEIPFQRCVNYKGRVVVTVLTWDLLRTICEIKIALKENKTMKDASEPSSWIYLAPKLTGNHLHPDLRPYIVEFTGVPTTTDLTLLGMIIESGYGKGNVCQDVLKKPIVDYYTNGRTTVARCLLDDLPEDNLTRRCLVYFDPKRPAQRGATTGIRLARRDTVVQWPIPPSTDDYPTVRFVGFVTTNQAKHAAWAKLAFAMEYDANVLIRHILPYELDGVIVGVTLGFTPYLPNIYPELNAAIRSPPVPPQLSPLVSPAKFPCFQGIFPTIFNKVVCYIATVNEPVCLVHRIPTYACVCGNPAKGLSFTDQLLLRSTNPSPAMRLASMSIGKGPATENASGDKASTSSAGGKRARTQGSSDTA